MKRFKNSKVVTTISIIVIFSLLCTILTGCTSSTKKAEKTIESLNSQISLLEEDIANLEAEKRDLENDIIDIKITKSDLESDITDIKVENGTAKYILTLNIRQTHISFDIRDYIKDELNEISIDIPVDKEYYDSLDIGDTISNEFRVGSLVLYGSFGSWDITVEDKKIQ